MEKRKCSCWKGYKRVPGTKPCAPGSCKYANAKRRVLRRAASKAVKGGE